MVGHGHRDQHRSFQGPEARVGVSALDEVEALSGLFPICSHCHRIRDDQEYRNRLARPKAADPRRIPRVPRV